MQGNTDTRLGTENLYKLILSLAVPSVAAQIINVLYNIVDRIFIGHIEGIGNLALSGVGVTFPIIMVVSAFSAFAGMGGAPLAAIKLGAQDKDGAEKILGNSACLLFICSVVLTGVLLLFKEPLLYMFGASADSFKYANDYITIYLCGTLFVQFALGLNAYITCQGNAKVAMLSVMIGAVSNIILDAVFIFVLNMGVKGAALATIISQCMSAIWVVRFLISKKSAIRIKKCNLRLNKKITFAIASLGISPFIMQSTESLVTIVLNSGLQKYGGDLYVGSMTIMMSVLQLVVTPLNGFTHGVQSIISYNFGAGNDARVKKTFKITITIALIISAITCSLAILFPQMFARLFSDNTELVLLTSKMMPVFLGGMWLFGVQAACQSTFLGLGQAKISLLLALLRKVVLLVPLAIILPTIFKTPESIYYAEPVSDILACLTTLTIFILTFNKILKKGPQV